MDFTFTTYSSLIFSLLDSGYFLQTFVDFINNPYNKTLILRHDVDRLPANALRMAKLEHDIGVAATYFFRSVSGSFNKSIMSQIKDLGHEIGYHYEDLTIAKGDPKKAIRHFEENLARFRSVFPVETICMHGSPLSRHDNRDLWKHYDYRDFGIIGEPYFDVDFNEVFYITDTGRKWNNEGASIRDRVESGFDIPVKSTFHLISLAEEGALPDRLMINVHPQRWFDFGPGWGKELVWQNVKNVIKKVLSD